MKYKRHAGLEADCLLHAHTHTKQITIHQRRQVPETRQCICSEKGTPLDNFYGHNVCASSLGLQAFDPLLLTV